MIERLAVLITLTNGYHALGIVVEILEHHFTKSIYLAATAYSETTRVHTVVYAASSYTKSHVLVYAQGILFFAQKPALLFQSSQQPAQLPHHLTVARPVSLILTYYDGEIEDELVPLVLLLFFDANRVANNAVVVDAASDKSVAELLSGN